jgi:preprotein translocase subunit SecB
MAEDEVNNGATENPEGSAVEGQAAGGQEAEGAQPQFVMQRVYLKDVSFESPVTPAVFKQEWKPQMGVDLRTQSTTLDDDNYEVVLTLTVTAKLEGETAYLVEVQQAGIFLARGIEADEMRRVLAILCPNMLFPYAREAIDGIVTKGTFPALMLAQVNFDALYQQAMQQAQQKAEAEAGEGAAVN